MKKLVIIIVCWVIPLWGFSQNEEREGNDSYLYEIESDLSAIGEKIFNVVTKTLESKGLKPSENELECFIEKYENYYKVYVAVADDTFPLDNEDAIYGYKKINGYVINFEICASLAKEPYFPFKLPIKLSKEKKKIMKPSELNNYISWTYYITMDGKIKLRNFLLQINEI